MSDPDVEHAGWAVGGRGSRLRRRRNPLLGLAVLLLVLGGVAATAYGITSLVVDAGVDEDDVVATGTVAALDGSATPAAVFTARQVGEHAVWIRTPRLSNRREIVVAGTACAAVSAGREVARFRGSRQGTAVEVGRDATVGVVDVEAAGPVAVTCRHVPWGRRGRRGVLREAREFRVVRGSPGAGLGGLWPLFGGLAAGVAGVSLWPRWRAGSLRARRT